MDNLISIFSSKNKVVSTPLLFAAVFLSFFIFFTIDSQGQDYEWTPFASSVLAPQSGNTYNAANANDGLLKTAWVEGVSGYGVGETIFFVKEGGPETGVNIAGFFINNGYCKDKKTWEKNSRVRTLRVYHVILPDIFYLLATVTLLDTMEEQMFGFDEPVNVLRGESIAFEIVDVYPGTKYTDTAISEIIMLYYGW